MNYVKDYIYHIAQIRKKTGWTQSELASRLEVTFATVNRWINGHTQPHPGQIQRISQLFKEIVGVQPLSSDRLKQLIKKVDAVKMPSAKLKKLLKKDDILNDYLLELTYHSDAIEGSTLTKNETQAVLFDKATIAKKSLIEHLEAVNHAAILRNIFCGSIQTPITEDLILMMHHMLMQGIRDDAGSYAKYQRAIKGVNILLPHPEDIPEEMRIFLRQVNRVNGHPIEHIAKMHAIFEAIHPFGDGNGRIGRLIIILQLISHGYPPCLIKIDERADYYDTLELAQRHSHTHLLEFLIKSVLSGCQIMKKYA